MTSFIDDFIDIPEVAFRTGYAECTIRNKIRTGALPAIRRGRKLFVNVDDVPLLFAPAN